MAINKGHPRYEEYKKRFEELAEQQQKEADAIPYSGGQDGPLTDVYKKYANKLKVLQREYEFLFTKDGKL